MSIKEVKALQSAHNSTKSLDTISQQTDVMKKLQAFVCSDLVELTVFNDPSFTILRPIALQMFSAPCSSAASERVFSQAGLIMRPTRSRLCYASQTCVSKMQQTTAVIN